MKYIQILFGFSIGILFLTEWNIHNFFHATGITIVYIVLVIVIKKWICGEMDEIEEPKGVLGFSGNDKKEK